MEAHFNNAMGLLGQGILHYTELQVDWLLAELNCGINGLVVPKLIRVVAQKEAASGTKWSRNLPLGTFASRS